MIADQLAECAAVGRRELLDNVKLGLFCSIHCPGKLILRTYELVRRLRDGGVTLLGGFHSPMEQECLTILLRGTQPVIVCLARSLHEMRISAEYKQPLDQGRLLLLSPFEGRDSRITLETAVFRNRFVAALAEPCSRPAGRAVVVQTQKPARTARPSGEATSAEPARGFGCRRHSRTSSVSK